MKKLSIEDVDVSSKRVLMRVDYNVPLDENGNVTDNTRIKATIPTLKYLLDKKAKIILIAHLGRPKGKPNPKYSLKSASAELSKLIGREVKFVDNCIGENVTKEVMSLSEGEIILLENLRFYSEEEKNDPEFAKKLASLGEIFIQEAFGAVHRAHASTAGVNAYLKSAAGFLLKKEIDYLDTAVTNPERPFLAILGGAKVSDKIDVINNLINKVDVLIIGGGMAYTFLKSQGIKIGKSLLEQDKVGDAARMYKEASSKKVLIMLPNDHVVAKEIKEGAKSNVTSGVDIEDDYIGVDIGPLTIEKVSPVIMKAKTILWNGPMGVFEIGDFAKGTMSVAAKVAEATKKGAISIVGGGDSVSAVKKSGVAGSISHISTGGGASLEYLEGKVLPGIAALSDKN